MMFKLFKDPANVPLLKKLSNSLSITSPFMFYISFSFFVDVTWRFIQNCEYVVHLRVIDIFFICLNLNVKQMISFLVTDA